MIDFFRPQPEDLLPLRSGLLAGHLDNFAALLARQGYCRSSGWQKVRLVADMSQWLAEKHFKLVELDEHQAGAFLKARWKIRSRVSGDSATLSLLLRHLREIGVLPACRPPVVGVARDFLQRDYEKFLLRERGLVPGTVGAYLPIVRRFLAHRFPKAKLRLRQLRASDVVDFVFHASQGCGRSYLQLATSALRSFLGFLLQRGRITTPLASAVPTVAGGRLSDLPRFLEATQVEKLLKSCDRRVGGGRRDLAILLLLARLGLRAGEVVDLSLDDIDWSIGELRIRGKGARVDQLPLPEDVGKALADYLKKGRPECSSRRVFIRRTAPHEALAGPSCVGSVVRAALTRAGLHPHYRGSHLLRHSLATRMLRAGASLAQIGQVLRHQQTQTTEIYAKVDLNALRRLAQPWPGGAR